MMGWTLHIENSRRSDGAAIKPGTYPGMVSIFFTDSYIFRRIFGKLPVQRLTPRAGACASVRPPLAHLGGGAVAAVFFSWPVQRYPLRFLG